MLRMVLLKTVSGFLSCAKGQIREISDHHVGQYKNIVIIKIQIRHFLAFCSSPNSILKFS